MTLILLSIVVILQVFDFASTAYALRTQTAAEGNPLLRRLMDWIGVIPTLLLTKVLAAALAVYLWKINSSFWLIVLAVAYTVIVINNLWLIYKKKN